MLLSFQCTDMNKLYSSQQLNCMIFCLWFYFITNFKHIIHTFFVIFKIFWLWSGYFWLVNKKNNTYLRRQDMYPIRNIKKMIMIDCVFFVFKYSVDSDSELMRIKDVTNIFARFMDIQRTALSQWMDINTSHKPVKRTDVLRQPLSSVVHCKIDSTKKEYFGELKLLSKHPTFRKNESLKSSFALLCLFITLYFRMSFDMITMTQNSVSWSEDKKITSNKFKIK